MTDGKPCSLYFDNTPPAISRLPAMRQAAVRAFFVRITGLTKQAQHLARTLFQVLAAQTAHSHDPILTERDPAIERDKS
jgi:hypothetical protein